jgi:hypothetical protein
MGPMSRLVDHFESAREFAPPEDVRVTGGWSSARRLRYARPEQAGTGEGPYVETTDWRWDGAVEAAGPMTALVVLATDDQIYWAKAERPEERRTP